MMIGAASVPFALKLPYISTDALFARNNVTPGSIVILLPAGIDNELERIYTPSPATR